MEENKLIDLTKILENFKTGTKLECSLYTDVYFIRLDVDNDEYPIVCRIGNDGENICFYRNLTKYGQVYNSDKAKCIIYPTTNNKDWRKYLYNFSDKDLLVNKSGNLIICYKKKRDLEVAAYGYFTVDLLTDECLFYNNNSPFLGEIAAYRKATDNEILKMNKILLKHHFRFNLDTKNLDIIKIPKFKKGYNVYNCKVSKNMMIEDIVIGSNPNDYKYLLEDGVLYDELELCECYKPFKVGDIVTDGEYEYEITRTGELAYDTDCGKTINFCNIDYYQIVLTNEEKFDYKNLKPFDKVIVYTSFGWVCDFFSHTNSDYSKFYCITDVYEKIVPFNDETIKLLGTHDNIPFKYRLKEKVEH